MRGFVLSRAPRFNLLSAAVILRSVNASALKRLKGETRQTACQAIDGAHFEFLKGCFQGSGLSDDDLRRIIQPAEETLSASYAEWARRDSHSERDPESKGYARLFEVNAVDPIRAQKLASDAIQHGRRTVENNEWIAVAYDAVRFLASSHHRLSVRRHANLLLRVSQKTSIIPALFAKAGLNEDEFLFLLYRVVHTNGFVNFDRLRAIASQLQPFLSLPRGRKVTAASAAHEHVMRQGIVFRIVPPEWRTNWRGRGNEHVDALTLATRREFDDPTFQPRSARVRFEARITAAGA
jgi:hypothetical protein